MTAHERHARKRFYVLGDGVYAEDEDDEEAGGHLIVDAEAAHAASGAPDATFRFSRIAPGSDLQLDGQTRKTLAEAMTVAGGHGARPTSRRRPSSGAPTARPSGWSISCFSRSKETPTC
jgi:hypothetical protein